MSAHSPGPWKADKNDAEPFYRVVDATGDLVARVRAQWTNGDVNALLIAAAPEMLALLRDPARGAYEWEVRADALLDRIDAVTPA